MGTRPVALGIALLGLCTCLVACGSSGAGVRSTSVASSSPGGGHDSAFLVAVKARVADFLSAKGTYVPPPASAPKPQPGKRIALVSCGSTVLPACGIEIAAAQAAAKAAGWTTTVIDTPNGDPVALGPGIRNAVAQHVDGIFMYYVDCKYVRDPLEAAKEAGIPVVNSNGSDCNEVDPSAKSQFTYTLRYNVGDGSTAAFDNETGVAQADYAIAKLDGRAKIAMFGDNTTQSFVSSVDATKAEVQQCGGCTFNSLLVPLGDIGTKLQGEAESFLLKYPGVNVALPGYEDILAGGLYAALRSAPGRHLLVSVAEGGSTGLAMMRSGAGQYGIGFALGWEGWAGIDSLNRIFNAQSPSVDSGIGIQLYDKDHNFPWQPPYDYQALYREAWGVS